MQIKETQVRKLNELIKDAEADDEVLNKLNDEMAKETKVEGQQRLKTLHTKYVIQQQMKDRVKQKEESKYEYERDKKQVEDIIRHIAEEDYKAMQAEMAKKQQARTYMEYSYKEKEERLKLKKQEELREKEREREYFRNVAKRENELKAKKAAVQEEKDRIFQKLCEEKKIKEAEKEYWENVRNELYVEELNRKTKLKELEEQEKKARQKEIMLASAIEQAQMKEERKRLELEEEKEFKRKLLEKFKEDEKLEQFNMMRRKQKEMDYKKEIERQWTLKLEQYKLQKDYELKVLQQQKEEEQKKREFIESEKQKLIRENEEILKTYLTKDYNKTVSKQN